jgi:hypothetical protein
MRAKANNGKDWASVAKVTKVLRGPYSQGERTESYRPCYKLISQRRVSKVTHRLISNSNSTPLTNN